MYEVGELVQTGTALSASPMNGLPEIDAEVQDGAAARAGSTIVRVVKAIAESAVNAQFFAVISLMGEETTLKSEVSSRHARDTA